MSKWILTADREPTKKDGWVFVQWYKNSPASSIRPWNYGTNAPKDTRPYAWMPMTMPKPCRVQDQEFPDGARYGYPKFWEDEYGDIWRGPVDPSGRLHFEVIEDGKWVKASVDLPEGCVLIRQSNKRKRKHKRVERPLIPDEDLYDGPPEWQSGY